jgi:hypothetical protein
MAQDLARYFHLAAHKKQDFCTQTEMGWDAPKDAPIER